MSLTSYRAAPPRVKACADEAETSHGAGRRNESCDRSGVIVGGMRVWFDASVVGRPGSDLLSRALGHSTIGAEGFHGRVRNGIGCNPLAITTRSSNDREIERQMRVLKKRHVGEGGLPLCAKARDKDQANRAISTG